MRGDRIGMNKKVGMISAVVNACAVCAFALSMLFDFDFGGYLVSMLIAFSFIPLICAFAAYGSAETRVLHNTAMLFAAMYATFILLIYFAQVTTVRLGDLSESARALIDYQQFGLFFNYNLLGYGFMSLSTFFVGLAIVVKSKSDRILKWLLQIHGVFAISGLVIPMLGLFHQDMQGADWIGVAVLLFWCVYFIPIGILSFLHFKNKVD